MDTWVNHERGLFDDGDTSGTWNVSSTQFAILCRAIEATLYFEEPTNFPVYVRQYMTKREITRSTMVNYLLMFQKLVEFIRAYKRSSIPTIMDNDWHKIIKDVRRKNQKGSLKEKKMKRDLFSKVPDMEGVALVVNKIEELCNEDLEENKLTLEDQKVFNFVFLSSNMKGRVGPLADLTWDDVKRMKKHGKLTSDNHKTGHYYDQEIKIHSEQFPWLKRLRDESRNNDGYRPRLVLEQLWKPKTIHSHRQFAKFFDEEILEKDYNGTSIRKMWDAYVHYNSDSIPTEARAFHTMQSSHRKETAEKHYIVPSTSGIDFYHNTLKNVGTSSSSKSITTKSSATKSPATKSSATKSPAAKSSATKSPATKSSATKSSATKRKDEDSESETSFLSCSSEADESKFPLQKQEDQRNI